MNAFEILGFSPRPSLGKEELKARFMERSGPLHPDRVHGLSAVEREEATRRFAELNAAHRLLQNPRDRLNLLLEMETGKKPRDVQRIPPGTMDLFAEVGQACRDADAFLASRPAADASPIQKAAARGQAAGWKARLEATLAHVDERADRSRKELEALDARWVAGGDRTSLLEPLENLARMLSYIERWRGQIAERLLELSLGS